MAQTTALVAAAQKGDRDAAGDLIRAFYPRVLKIVEVRLGKRLRRLFDPGDIAQSVFGRAYQRIPHFQNRGTGSFAAWLDEIVECTIRDKARWLDAAKRGREQQAVLAVPRDHPATSGASPSRAAEKEEDLEKLHRAMGMLAERERRVVEWRMFLGLPGPEVAAALGVSDVTARKIYSRAVQKLGRLVRSAG